jgi:hypothetical protein
MVLSLSSLPFGPEHFGRELSVERLMAEGRALRLITHSALPIPLSLLSIPQSAFYNFYVPSASVPLCLLPFNFFKKSQTIPCHPMVIVIKTYLVFVFYLYESPATIH